MAAASETIRILLIRAWTEPLAPLRAALRDIGINARVTRVDIEPALNAALSRTRFDVVVYDPKTPNVSRSVLDERLRENRCLAPLVTIESAARVIEQIKRALAERLN